MKILLTAGAIVAVSLLLYFFVYTPLQKTEINEDVPVAETQGTATTSGGASEAITSPRVPIKDTSIHPASGFVRIIDDGEKRYLRYEDLNTINGPDLFVYLATETSAEDFINLGPLKATNGSFNYEIPEGTDLSKYSQALIWCKAFGVLFNSADLKPLL